MNKLVLAAPLLVLVTSCTSSSSSGFSQPKPDAFTSGSCRSLAPSVLKLGKDLHDLGSTKKLTQAQRDTIRKAQDAVRALQPSLDASLATPVQDLVTAVGVVRLRTDTNSYDPSLAATALTSYRSLVATCTGTPAPTPTPS